MSRIVSIIARCTPRLGDSRTLSKAPIKTCNIKFAQSFNSCEISPVSFWLLITFWTTCTTALRIFVLISLFPSLIYGSQIFNVAVLLKNLVWLEKHKKFLDARKRWSTDMVVKYFNCDIRNRSTSKGTFWAASCFSPLTPFSQSEHFIVHSIPRFDSLK